MNDAVGVDAKQVAVTGEVVNQAQRQAVDNRGDPGRVIVLHNVRLARPAPRATRHGVKWFGSPAVDKLWFRWLTRGAASFDARRAIPTNDERGNGVPRFAPQDCPERPVAVDHVRYGRRRWEQKTVSRSAAVPQRSRATTVTRRACRWLRSPVAWGGRRRQ